MSEKLQDLVPSPFDCQECGACCVCPDEMLPRDGTHVLVSEEDAEAIPLSFLVKHRDFGDCWTMRAGPVLVAKLIGRNRTGGPDLHVYRGLKGCMCLAGTVGKRCACGIYFQRPYACRQFTPGCEACLEARKEIGL